MNVRKPIRGIFFDLGWTILRPATGNWFITAKALEYINPKILRSIPQAKLNEAVSKAGEYFQNKTYLTEDEELELRVKFYRTVAEMLLKLIFQKNKLILLPMTECITIRITYFMIM